MTTAAADDLIFHASWNHAWDKSEYRRIQLAALVSASLVCLRFGVKDIIVARYSTHKACNWWPVFCGFSPFRLDLRVESGLGFAGLISVCMYEFETGLGCPRDSSLLYRWGYNKNRLELKCLLSYEAET